MCGYVKSKVHADNLASIVALEPNIKHVIHQFEMFERVTEIWYQRINQLQLAMLQCVKEIWYQRINHLGRSRGQH